MNHDLPVWDLLEGQTCHAIFGFTPAPDPKIAHQKKCTSRENQSKMILRTKKRKETVKKSKNQSCYTSSGTEDKLPPKYQDQIRK